jgi:ribosome-associated protein
VSDTSQTTRRGSVDGRFRDISPRLGQCSEERVGTHPQGRGTVTATDQALDLARVAVAAAADKKAQDIVVLDVSDRLVITDCFVIASAPNERQVEAIVDEVEEKLRQHGAKPTRREGTREGRWVLLDFVDVVVHVQHTEERGFYGLDRLWKDCPRVRFPEAEVAQAGADRDGSA